jgi:hypothetical protein
MSLFSEPAFYYLLAFIAGIALFVLSVTGTIQRGYSRRWIPTSRGGPIVSVQSVPLRIAFFFISVAILAFLVLMIRHQIATVMQAIGQPS